MLTLPRCRPIPPSTLCSRSLRPASQVFPPKTDIGLANLVDRIDRMSSLSPTWMHVTWGAGGSTQARSLELAGASQGMGLETCLHLTCTNLEEGVLEKTLKRAKELGVVNLLALRGGAFLALVLHLFGPW